MLNPPMKPEVLPDDLNIINAGVSKQIILTFVTSATIVPEPLDTIQFAFEGSFNTETLYPPPCGTFVAKVISPFAETVRVSCKLFCKRSDYA